MEGLLRKHAQIIYGCSGGKEDFAKYWPIEEIDSLIKSSRPTKRTIHNILQDAQRRELERRLLESQSKMN